ncbi:hypothetical protein R1flu_018906 [Riccia fluitans]|uniref:DUF659 domain-containing protein n=1 Tax=Riccia fluitans TaxID=41844 RepID=A0ABD1ZHC0_9MARC
MWGHNFYVRAIVSCDGWTNQNGHPQMNIMFINRYGEMLHAHADGNNITKDAKWVSRHILKSRKEVRSKNVLQFTADNASVNILTEKFMRAEYPHIIFGGCVAHDGATLLKPGVTRFTTNIIMLDQTYHLLHCLKKMVVSEQWTTWITDLHRPSNTKIKIATGGGVFAGEGEEITIGGKGFACGGENFASGDEDFANGGKSFASGGETFAGVSE